ncbi:MAG: SOS response-associated peptidase [Bacteroidia bacterium]|nr:SOS response-associated peptidase [Bacteroidia bacterium]
MCFYYAVTKKSVNALVNGKIIRNDQLNLFEDQLIVNGFDHPFMPVITDANPDDISFFKWGFLPNNIENTQQADEFLSKYNTLNAKSEEIESSHLYANSFKNRRCLVLCSGFFEWRKVKKEKIPYYVTLKNEELFVFAGIWNETKDSKGQITKSFAVLTIDANEIMAKVHNTKLRMPLILSPESAKQWINKEQNIEKIKSIITPVSSDLIKAHTIKKFMPINSKKIYTSDLIAYYNYPEIFGLLSEQETKL